MSTQLSSFPAMPGRKEDIWLDAQGQAMHRSLGRLPRRVQQIFLLSRMDALPYADIALHLDIDLAQVEQAMIKALQHCRQHRHDAPCAISSIATADASRWYIHLQSPQATPSQRIEFRHWLDASGENLAAFEATERLWRQLNAPARLLGASGWHRRKRSPYLLWCVVTACLFSLLMTAEAFA
jgi:hypothetical protein